MEHYLPLVKAALAMRERAYAPYSNFYVGAALLCEDESIYLGCNIENASYSATICAERTALFSAISDGKHTFKAIAVAGSGGDECIPCGICLQVMTEFCSPDSFTVLAVQDECRYTAYRLSELLPKGFQL